MIITLNWCGCEHSKLTFAYNFKLKGTTYTQLIIRGPIHEESLLEGQMRGKFWNSIIVLRRFVTTTTSWRLLAYLYVSKTSWDEYYTSKEK